MILFQWYRHKEMIYALQERAESRSLVVFLKLNKSKITNFARWNWKSQELYYSLFLWSVYWKMLTKNQILSFGCLEKKRERERERERERKSYSGGVTSFAVVCVWLSICQILGLVYVQMRCWPRKNNRLEPTQDVHTGVCHKEGICLITWPVFFKTVFQVYF